MDRPEPASVWRHVKTGHDYIVIDCAVIESTMTDAVLYRRYTDFLSEPRIWVRPLAEFMDGRFIATIP